MFYDELREFYDALFNENTFGEYTVDEIFDALDELGVMYNEKDKSKNIDEHKSVDNNQPKEQDDDVEEDDVVNHPRHYTAGGMECIDEMIMLFGIQETMSFCKLNAWKYRARALNKGGQTDIDKSDWYVAKYKELQDELDKRKWNKYEMFSKEVKEFAAKGLEINSDAIVDAFKEL